MKYLLYADGGSRGNPGAAAYGTAIYDAQGNVYVEIAEFLGVATNNVAEYSGLLAGLQYLAERHPNAVVEVRMDSKLVVEQMSGRWKIKHPDMRNLAMQSQRLISNLKVTFNWIPREQNAHADRLANEALDLAQIGKTEKIFRSYT